VVFSIVGVLLIRYRVAVAKLNADTQRAVNGKLGEQIARRGATPFWTAVVGATGLAIGLSMFAMGLFRHVW
jgi:hypothetical protein